MKWQPIETAPEDGRPILCYNRMVGAWNTQATEMHGRIEYPCGYWGGLGAYFPRPSHWMPLPDPPDD